jgi:hypothetical protein
MLLYFDAIIQVRSQKISILPHLQKQKDHIKAWIWWRPHITVL